MAWCKTSMDRHCLVAAILFVISDIIAVFGFIAATKNRDHFESIEQLYQLDPTFIESEWHWTTKYNNVNLSYEIINSFAWFVLSIPST